MAGIRRRIAAIAPASLAGLSLALATALASGARPGQCLGAMLLGVFSGLVVLGLIRLFPVARWAYPIAGMLVGPLLPLALTGRQAGGDERGAVWLLGALFGVVVGLLEWARQVRVEREG